MTVLTVIGLWVTIENPFPEVLYFYPYFLLFALFGYLPLLARREGRPIVWVHYLCPVLDMGLFTLLVMVPNPLESDVVPAQLRLRFGNEIYLFAFIVSSAFAYSPLLVMWSGMYAAVSWSIATFAVVMLPDSIASMPSHAAQHATAVQRITDPHRVFLNVWGRQVVVFLITAGTLAALVRRARRLVEGQPPPSASAPTCRATSPQPGRRAGAVRPAVGAHPPAAGGGSDTRRGSRAG